MDNISQDIEKDEKALGTEDIKFDEVLDIDELQKKLQEKLAQAEPAMDEDSDSITASELFDMSEKRIRQEKESGEQEASTEQSKSLPAVKPSAKNDDNAKKYVIYVNSENIDFMENLSLNERREVINKILKDQNQLTIEQIQSREKQRRFSHSILALVTFVICVPIIFIIVNKAIDITIVNYQKARGNFSRLYKEEGKIKMSNPDAVPTIKY